MDDVLLIIANRLLADPSPLNLLAFVMLQATHRSVWIRFKHDRELWSRLLALTPKWSLPEHLGLRRRAITSIKLLSGQCVACRGFAPRVFVSIQARLCRPCCRRLMVSDFHLAWHYGVVDPRAAFVARYTDGNVRVRFYLRRDLKLREPAKHLSSAQRADFARRWPGVRSVDVWRIA